ncbi:membrane metalloprotease [Flagellimonas halotolerans]|uniref:Membrane metalloprotease n=1 Tax=Flagellimonas halotolerans TaxID=3112164 RepID=A0ABU6IL45_9FLAO|nr:MULTISPECIES: membrane metalloprotease [unclassified Allomuricauda]MEC3963950.1 membrane metalloprotease [Muricauda sp. SYSU M86414]MEC4263820.1 membrane metalloprotease [Muricauda sp. SYSU M84420]
MKQLGILLLTLCLLGCSSDSGPNVNDDGKEASDNITENRKSVGESASDLLDDVNYDELHIEIQYVQGLEPSASTLDHFENFLVERLRKSGGITIELVEIPSPGQDTYSIADVRNLEDDMRTAYNQGSTLKVFGLFLDGAYSENSENGSVLGIAYRNTSFVIFAETIREFSGQPLAPSTTVLESTVLDHEFGHLLGLVNAGTPLQSAHQDTEHGRHCTAEDCLMFWTAETGEGLVNMISGGDIPELDAACLADLQANGGR